MRSGYSVKLIIIDDDTLVSESLAAIVELAQKTDGGEKIQLCGIGKNGLDAVRLYAETKADVVLMDIRMPVMDGLSAFKEMKKSYPDVRVLFLTTFIEDEYIAEALRLGACGYLMKSKAKAIIPALRAVASGQHVYGDEIISRLSSAVSSGRSANDSDIYSADEHLKKLRSCFSELSQSEWDILKLIAAGKTNLEIAERLHFSAGTVRNKVSSIFEKTGITNRTMLTVQYYKAGYGT